MRAEIDNPKERILALEIRPRVTGFAVFEAPARLLDWGRRKHKGRQGTLSRIASKRISALMELHQPSIIIARTRHVTSSRGRNKIAAILRIVRREGKKRSVMVQTIRADSVRDFFASHQCTSKHQRATLIARWFPELSWKLPPTRKMWKSEDHRMVIFDAVATALTFMNRSPPTGG